MNRKFSFIIPIVVFIVLLMPIAKGFKITKEQYKSTKETINNVVAECNEGNSSLSENACKNFQTYKITYQDYQHDFYKNSYGKYENILLVSSAFVIVLLYVLPLFRNKKIKIKDYRDLIIEIFKNAYPVAWVYPTLVLIKGILTFIGVSMVNSIPIYYIFCPILETILAFIFMMIIINLALMVARKVNNPLFYTITSCIFYSFIALIINKTGNLLVHFGANFGKYLNILTIDFSEINYISAFIVIGLLSLLSWFIVYLLYRDEKKLINYCKENG